jgi:hypothetical protein
MSNHAESIPILNRSPLKILGYYTYPPLLNQVLFQGYPLNGINLDNTDPRKKTFQDQLQIILLTK